MVHRIPLRFQLVALQLGIVLAVLTAVGAVTIRMQEQQLRDAYKGRLIGWRKAGRLPSVVDALGTASAGADHPSPSPKSSGRPRMSPMWW